MKLFISLLPSTYLSGAMQIVGGLVVSLIAMSFIEYYLHGYMLHQKKLPRIVYEWFPMIGEEYYEHAVLHHETFYVKFNFEPDPFGKDLAQRIGFKTACIGALVLSPILIAATFLIGIIPALMFIATGVAYIFTWNTIHPEMHQPKYPFWTKWRVYKFLAGYHYVHHDLHRKSIHRNINLVIPFADYVVGRNARPIESQLAEMKSFGYLD